jgi:hypothetical protein
MGLGEGAPLEAVYADQVPFVAGEALVEGIAVRG